MKIHNIFGGFIGAIALSITPLSTFATPLNQLANGDYSHGEYGSEIRPNISIRKSGDVILGVMYSGSSGLRVIQV